MSSSFKHFNYHHFDCHLPLSLWFQMTFHALLLIYFHSRYSWEEKDQELLCGQNCTFSLALLPSFNRKTDTLYFLIIVLFANHLYYRSWPYRRKHRKTKGTRCCSGSQNSFTRWEERVSSDLQCLLKTYLISSDHHDISNLLLNFSLRTWTVLYRHG